MLFSMSLFFRYTVMAKLNMIKCSMRIMRSVKYCEEVANADSSVLLTSATTAYSMVYTPMLTANMMILSRSVGLDR